MPPILRHTPGSGSFLACACLLALGLVGCAGPTRVNTVEPADMKALPQVMLLKNVSTDAGLGNGAHVINAYEGRTPAGLPRVQVNVVNDSMGECDFMWTAEWFDSAGMAIAAPPPHWTRVTLLRGQSTAVTFTAPSPQAVDWRLSMTRWRREP